jgi:hypothetical protein
MAVGSCKLQAVGVADGGPRIVTVLAVSVGSVVFPRKDKTLGCTPSPVVARDSAVTFPLLSSVAPVFEVMDETPEKLAICVLAGLPVVVTEPVPTATPFTNRPAALTVPAPCGPPVAPGTTTCASSETTGVVVPVATSI